MDESEFKRLLELFPVVRSGNYRSADSESGGSTSSSAQKEVPSQSIRGSPSSSAQKEISEWNNAYYEDQFWQKLRSAAEKQVTKEEAESFCKSFQRTYKKLAFEEISLEAAGKFVDSASSSRT